jgi:tRNA-Thr(GGU) m(6)t(6)A37 methyltransferase TsaA
MDRVTTATRLSMRRKIMNRREGEIALEFDPAEMTADASLIFIGRVRSPWTSRDDCPKNMAAARETARPARIELDPSYRPGLDGLARFSHAVLLTWLDRATRDLVVQKPRHADSARGVFALRSPVRPNPIGLHVVRVTGIDRENGVVEIDGIDLLDGTPVLDLKPYFVSTDAVPDAIDDRPPADA